MMNAWTKLKNKTSIMKVLKLTISEAIVLAVITEVLWRSQEVLLYGGDGAICVVVDPLPRCSALLKLSLLPPLQTNQELVDIKDDAAGLWGASLPWTLNQANARTPLLLSALNGTCTDTYYACKHTHYVYRKFYNPNCQKSCVIVYNLLCDLYCIQHKDKIFNNKTKTLLFL